MPANGSSAVSPSPSSVTLTPPAFVFGISTHFVESSSSFIGLNAISLSSLSVVVLFTSTGSPFEMSNEPMSLTSSGESTTSGLNANWLNLLVISSMLAKSSKLSIVNFTESLSCPPCPSVRSELFIVFVLNALSDKFPSVVSGNNMSKQSVFSTIVVTTTYFPFSGIITDSIPGKALLREFWEFSSERSNMKC